MAFPTLGGRISNSVVIIYELVLVFVLKYRSHSGVTTGVATRDTRNAQDLG